MGTKQVIVIRKDLNMRKGKMVAQGAHASLKVFTDCLIKDDYGTYKFLPSDDMMEWLNGDFTKICVSVDSDVELVELYTKAKLKRLPCSLIIDKGKTEFKQPTVTAIAIGPADIETIDMITGHLKLL